MATNPYLQDQANAITNQANQNLMNYQLPSINSGAQMAGGFGGSRQGIAQGLAIGQTNQGISNSLVGLYGNAYENDANRANQAAMQAAQLASNQSIAGMQNQTQRDLGFGNLGLGYTQAGNQYSLGLGNLGLGYTQAANQYSLGNRAADTSQFNAETSRGLGYGQLQQQGDQNSFNNQLAGANFQLQGLNALQGWNTNGVNLANQQQQLPLQNLGMLSNIGTSIGNQGAQSSQPGASTLQNALAGGLTLAQIYQLFNRGG